MVIELVSLRVRHAVSDAEFARAADAAAAFRCCSPTAEVFGAGHEALGAWVGAAGDSEGRDSGR